MQAEVERILAAIPADQLAIQWDARYEFAMLEGAIEVWFDDVRAGIVERLLRLGQPGPRPGFAPHLLRRRRARPLRAASPKDPRGGRQRTRRRARRTTTAGSDARLRLYPRPPAAPRGPRRGRAARIAAARRRVARFASNNQDKHAERSWRSRLHRGPRRCRSSPAPRLGGGRAVAARRCPSRPSASAAPCRPGTAVRRPELLKAARVVRATGSARQISRTRRSCAPSPVRWCWTW